VDSRERCEQLHVNDAPTPIRGRRRQATGRRGLTRDQTVVTVIAGGDVKQAVNHQFSGTMSTETRVPASSAETMHSGPPANTEPRASDDADPVPMPDGQANTGKNHAGRSSPSGPSVPTTPGA